jgi:hypothetical protein
MMADVLERLVVFYFIDMDMVAGMLDVSISM